MTEAIEQPRASVLADAEPRLRLGRRGFVIALAALAVGVAALTLYATRDGMGLSPDSSKYLQAAEQLLAGRGLTLVLVGGRTVPLTHFPPMYSFTLAAVAWPAGIEPVVAARVLNVALYAALAILAGWIFRRGAGLSRIAALLGAAILVLPIDLLTIHAMVWSEALFLVPMLAALALLGAYIERGRRAYLAGAAVAIALMLLTRYAAAGLVLGCVAALLACGRGRSWRRRLVDVVLFVAISCLPAAAWAARNVAQTGRAANRTIAYHPPSAASLKEGWTTLGRWVAPHEHAWVVVVILIATALVSARNAAAHGRPPSGVVQAAAWLAAAYAAFVLFSRTFLDAHTPLDARILAPLHVMVFLAVFAELARSRLPATAGRAARMWVVALITLAAVLLAERAAMAALWAYEAPERHLLLGTRRWRQSEMVDFVTTLPPNVLMYSNEGALVLLYTGRVTRELPGLYDPSTLRMADVGERIRKMAREMDRAGRAYVLYFRTPRSARLVSEADLARELDLQLIYSGRDGSVYRTRRGTSATMSTTTPAADAAVR